MDNTVTGALQRRIKELGLKQKFIASQIVISEVYLSMQLHGVAQMGKDEFFQMCGLLELNPKNLMKQYPLDFNRNGSISALNYRPRSNQI